MKARDRLVLGVVAVAGVMAALWFGVLAPKREEAAGLGDQIAAAQQRLDTANATATEAEQARASYGRDYATVARLGKATPPQADVPSLVYQLESSARRAKVDFRSVVVQDQPAAAPASDTKAAPAADAKAAPATDGAAPAADAPAATSATAGITPMLFSFTFEGSFFELHELLRSVGRFSRINGKTVRIKGRLLTLDAVTLSAGRSGFPQVKAEIIARAYSAPIPAQLPGGAAPSSPGAPNPSPATRVVP